MRKLYLFLLLSLFSTASFAIKARQGVTKIITVSGGVNVQATLQGDEYSHYWLGTDGTKYIFNSVENAYKPIDEATLSNNLRAKLAQRYAARKSAKGLRKAPNNAPIMGKKKGLIILVQFKDMAFKPANNPILYDKIVNQRGFTSSEGFVGSVKDYFLDQSQGQFEIDFDVVGPVTMANNYSYFGGNDTFGNDLRPGEMVAKACQGVDANVNFADYDWNGDGEVDMVYVLYAGQGEANSKNPSTIWPHEWGLAYNDYGKILLADGVYINTYACSNELGGTGSIDGIGTICHEFSHCLGLPDMYDVNYSGNFGMDCWDLMDYGSYNADGFIPAGFTAYERMFCGWQTPIELNTDQSVMSMEALNKGGDAYIIYNEGNRDEYYLLENRQKTGWDAALYGAGLLISHVDYDENIWNYNVVNANATVSKDGINNNHQRLTIFHADNREGVETLADLAGDVYPYMGNDSLTSNSVPVAFTYNANTDGAKMMNKGITGITRNGDGTVSFNFKATSPATVNDTLFYESFDKCNGTGGNDNRWNGSIATGLFLPDNIGWVAGSITGGYGAKQCARFGSGSANGNVTTPDIIINGNVTLSFKAAPWVSTSDGTTLLVYLNGETLLGRYTLTQGQWTNIKIPIVDAGMCYLTFVPDKRFFLDEVIITSDKTSNGIKTVEHSPVSNRIYTADGKFVGTNITTLPKGIYVIDGKKVVK